MDNTSVTLSLIASLLCEGEWSVETVSYRSRKLASLRVRRLRPDERPGTPPATRTNDRGMTETVYYPGGPSEIDE